VTSVNVWFVKNVRKYAINVRLICVDGVRVGSVILCVPVAVKLCINPIKVIIVNVTMEEDIVYIVGLVPDIFVICVAIIVIIVVVVTVAVAVAVAVHINTFNYYYLFFDKQTFYFVTLRLSGCRETCILPVLYLLKSDALAYCVQSKPQLRVSGAISLMRFWITFKVMVSCTIHVKISYSTISHIGTFIT
jgi:hypothetical protein